MAKFKELKARIMVSPEALLNAAGQGAQVKAEPRPEPKAVKRDD